MVNEPIRVRDVPEEYQIEIIGDEIVVWNDRSGRRYKLEELAPHTDED